MKKKDIDKIEEKNVNQISMEDSMCLGSVSLDKKKQLNDNKEKNKNINEILSEIEADSSAINFDEEVVEGRLEEVRKTESPKKKKKSRIVNTIFLVLNIVLMAFIVSSFMESYGNGLNISNIIEMQGNKLWWLLLGVGLYLMFILTEAGMFSCLIKGSIGKRKPYLSYRVGLIGKYYDSITPFSVGGQPFQIVALTKAGMNAGISTSLPIIKILVYNLVYTVSIFIAFVIGMPMVFTSDMVSNFVLLILNFVAIIGLIFTALSSVLFILIGNGKIVGRVLARWVVKVGYKLRLVKNYRATYNKIMIQVREYQNSMDFLRKNKGVMIKCVILCILQILAYFSIPFAVMLAFTANTQITFATWFICFVKFLICQMAAVILPLPGGTGMMELSFMIVFSTPDMFGINAAIGLLIWRILSYYLLIAHGFIQAIVDNTSDLIKSKRLNNNQINIKNVKNK